MAEFNFTLAISLIDKKCFLFILIHKLNSCYSGFIPLQFLGLMENNKKLNSACKYIIPSLGRNTRKKIHNIPNWKSISFHNDRGIYQTWKTQRHWKKISLFFFSAAKQDYLFVPLSNAFFKKTPRKINGSVLRNCTSLKPLPSGYKGNSISHYTQQCLHLFSSFCRHYPTHNKQLLPSASQGGTQPFSGPIPCPSGGIGLDGV